MNKRLLGAVVMLILCAGWLNAQSHDLKYKLKKGNDYRFYQETVMTITQSLGFIEQEIKNEFKGVTRFTPIGTEGINIILKTSFETMVINIESLMFNLNYDSSKPVNPEDKVSVIYDGIIGKEFNMVITPQGSVVRVDGINELISKVVSSMGNIQPQIANQLKKTMADQFGEQALIGNMEMILSIYPQGRKKVGEKWSTGTKLTSALKANLNNNWTLANAANQQWKLLGEGDISTSDAEAMMNGMKVTFNLTGKQKSEYVLNQLDGWFIKGKQSQRIEGIVKMNDLNQMEIPMKVISSTYLEKR